MKGPMQPRVTCGDRVENRDDAELITRAKARPDQCKYLGSSFFGFTAEGDSVVAAKDGLATR